MAGSVSCIFCSSNFYTGQSLIDHIYLCSSIPSGIKTEYIKDIEKSLKPKVKFNKNIFKTSSDKAQSKQRKKKKVKINTRHLFNEFTQNSIYAILTPTGNKR